MPYVIIWEFTVRPGMEKQFEEAYGLHGEWVSLFRQDPAFIRTELIRDLHDPRRYLTLDHWESEKAYDAFREHRRNDYKRIDALCDPMTETERELGRFDKLQGSAKA